jgi:transcriptional regulator with XRE-family HTH domain
MHLIRLRDLRLNAFLTQRELAEKAGLTQATIVRLERGQRLARPSTARRIADALGVEPRALVAPAAERTES